jgi:hypothetical protein
MMRGRVHRFRPAAPGCAGAGGAEDRVVDKVMEMDTARAAERMQALVSTNPHLFATPDGRSVLFSDGEYIRVTGDNLQEIIERYTGVAIAMNRGTAESPEVATALDALHRAVGDLVEAHRLWETGIRDIGDWHAAITAVAVADAAFEAAVLANAPIAGDGDREIKPLGAEQRV